MSVPLWEGASFLFKNILPPKTMKLSKKPKGISFVMRTGHDFFGYGAKSTGNKSKNTDTDDR